MTDSKPVRALVAWYPDWPVVAAAITAGIVADEPVAVVGGAGGRVVACSAAARARGLHVGMRRREAEACCPGVRVVAADADGEARAFEVVATAVEAIAPRLEVLRPGTLALPTRGPSRYFGGDHVLAARVAAQVEEALDSVSQRPGKGRGPDGRDRCRVGMADGLFAALLAARKDLGGLVVEPGASAAWLAPMPVASLHHAAAMGFGPTEAVAELAELLPRLGLRTLGAVAGVPVASLVGRFGPAGATVARLCRGLDDRPPRPRVSPPDLTVAAELDPPAAQVEAAAFVARALAGELAERLAVRGLACARVRIEAETEHGETLSRRWRTEGLALASALVERTRWQLDGWCNGTAAVRPSGGISVLRLVPEEVAADRGSQLGFWGGATAADERAARGVARLQGLLGPEAVVVPRPRGGRGPGTRVTLVAAHADVRGSARRSEEQPAEGRRADSSRSVGPGASHAVGQGDGLDAPWPGRVPAPSPVVVHQGTVPAEVVDTAGRPVQVSGRGLVTAAPAWVSLVGGPWVEVAAWCGPWPTDERWWDEAARCRQARIQVVTTTGDAYLLVLQDRRWTVEATYD